MSPQDLLRDDCFHVEIEGISSGGFVSCRGLELETRVFLYREGGFPGVRQFPDGPAPGRLVLERGLAGDRTLWEWYVSGEPRPGAVVLVGADGRERMRWKFEAGWLCRWQGPELDARAGAVAVELVEIAHEGLEWHRP